MHVDDALRIPRHESRREHLHVARQHHQLDPMLLQKRQLGLLRLRLVGLVHGHVSGTGCRRSRPAPARWRGCRQSGECGSAALDGVPVEHVQEAMLVLRNENRRGGPGRRIRQPPLHLKAIGQRLKIRAKSGIVQGEIRQIPLNAHEEQAQVVILV